MTLFISIEFAYVFIYYTYEWIKSIQLSESGTKGLGNIKMPELSEINVLNNCNMVSKSSVITFSGDWRVEIVESSGIMRWYPIFGHIIFGIIGNGKENENGCEIHEQFSHEVILPPLGRIPEIGNEFTSIWISHISGWPARPKDSYARDFRSPHKCWAL